MIQFKTALLVYFLHNQGKNTSQKIIIWFIWCLLLSTQPATHFKVYIMPVYFRIQMDDIKLHSSATCTANQPNIIILSTQTCYFWHFSFLRKCAAKTLVVLFLSHRLRTYITIIFSWKNNTTAIQFRQVLLHLQYYIVSNLCTALNEMSLIKQKIYYIMKVILQQNTQMKYK